MLNPLRKLRVFLVLHVLAAFGLAENFELDDLNRLSEYEVVPTKIETILAPDAPLSHSTDIQKRITFSAFGRFFELELRACQLYSPKAQIRWVGYEGVFAEQPPQIYFKGKVSGDDSSWLRLAIEQDEVEGIISTEEDVYFIVPGRRFGVSAWNQASIIYRLSDVIPLWDDHQCAIDVSVSPEEMIIDVEPGRDEARAQSLLDRYRLSVDELRSSLPAGTLKEAEIHVVADGAYHARHQGDSASRIASVINAISGIYEAELDVRITIGQSTVYTEATDPFTSSNNPSDLLNNFTFDEPHVQGFDLAHLFTGRNVDGSVVGNAWLGVVCNGTYGTGFSQDLSSLDSRIVLTAHEMGHNFDSGHDGSSGHGCDWGFVMWPSIIPSAREFSTCSEVSMNDHIDTRSCLAEVDVLPGAPDPISPTGSVTTNRPSFSWTEVIEADEYRLHVERGGTTVIDDWSPPNCNAGVCTVSPSENLEEGAHRWRVLARNSAGDSSWSEYAYFTVSVPSPPSAPTNLRIVP
jgi:hypothetical protein